MSLTANSTGRTGVGRESRKQGHWIHQWNVAHFCRATWRVTNEEKCTTWPKHLKPEHSLQDTDRTFIKSLDKIIAAIPACTTTHPANNATYISWSLLWSEAPAALAAVFNKHLRYFARQRHSAATISCALNIRRGGQGLLGRDTELLHRLLVSVKLTLLSPLRKLHLSAVYIWVLSLLSYSLTDAD